MRKSTLPLTAILFLALLASRPGICDELKLINGDRLSGQAVRMEQGHLYFKAPYVSEEMKIPWSEVANLSTDNPVWVVLQDGTTLKGKTMVAEQGRMKVKMGSIVETVSFDLAKVEKMNTEQPVSGAGAGKPEFRAELNVGVTKTSGNSETSAAHVDAEIVTRTGVNRYTAGVEYNYESEDEETSVRNALAYGKYDYFLTEKWYLYANTLFKTDPIADLRLRSTIGVGAGYQFLDTDRANLYVEAGPSYVNEDHETGEDSDTAAARWAINFDYGLFDWVDFFHFHEGYQGIEKTEDLFVRTRTGFRFPVNDSFHTTLEYDWEYDKSPAEGAEKIDRKYLFTVGYTFE